MPRHSVVRIASVLALIGLQTAAAAPLGYGSPPRAGDRIAAQRLVLVCDSAAGARYSARTGYDWA